MPSSPSRRVAVPRVTLLVALLALTVVIAASLAYEAHDAARSHRVTAERALRDYASVAAWEYVASVREQLDATAGQILSPLTSVRASSPYEVLASPDLLDAPTRDVLACQTARGDSARIVFRIDLRDGSVAVGATGADSEFLRWLRDTIVTHTRLRYRPEMRYAAVADPARSPGRIVFFAVRYAQHGAPLAAYGFTTCPRAVADGVLRVAMNTRALLPTAVTGGAATDSLLVLSVSSAGGQDWFRSAPVLPAAGVLPYAGEASFEGAGAPLIVRATLRANAPELLLVDRPSETRIPVLVGLLALTAALAVVALVQLRREHELARLRADFTSSVSHELRTPLAQILLFSETLKLGRVRSEADRRLAIDTVVHEARRLMQMVDNVLHFARTTEGRLRLEPAPAELGPLLDSIVAAFAPLAEERGSRVVTEIREPVTAFVDAGAVRQIALNLLDNALKFGPRGQTVRLTVDRVGERARLAVEDMGPGIPPADRERVWTPYVRLGRERNAANEGCGIGLAVVRELTELHLGEVRIEDGPSGGARFVVDLPIADGARAAELSARTGGARRERPREPRGWTARARRRAVVERESSTSKS